MTLLQSALDYAALGWAVFPLHAPVGQGCSCRQGGCQNIGKHPRTEHGLSDASIDPQQIAQWWRQWPYANIGIATGPRSGLLVVDLDYPSGADVSLDLLDAEGCRFPESIESVTGRGRHLYYRYPAVSVRNSTGKLGAGMDIRGDGGYVVAPPSLHASGVRYEWEASSTPGDTPLEPPPDWMIARLTALPATPSTPLPTDGRILEGQRNSLLASVAGSMRRRGASEAAILAAITEENKRCMPPLPADELRKIATSIGRYPPAARAIVIQPPETPLPKITDPYGDVHNAGLLAQHYGSSIRYCEALGGWLLWTGTHWQRDTAKQIMELARATMREALIDATAHDEEPRLKYLAKCFTHQKLNGMVSQASSWPTVVMDAEAFDTDPWSLNCLNGTLDLRTGQLRAHDPAAYLTKCLRIPYLPQAEAPTWQRFLWRIMGGDASLNGAPGNDKAWRLVGFLQRAVGYALTGLTNEDCLFILYGSGRNGKSRFLDACHGLLSGYAKTAQMTSFLHQDRETVRNDLADLQGVRLVSAIETGPQARFSEGLLKQLTGGDRIKARFLFREYFEFLPAFKLFLAFNHYPKITGTDPAIWERVNLVPFEVFIPPEERDKYLADKLQAELPGILAWAVQGCLAWQRDGLNPPPEVKHATAAYKAEMDRISGFLDEACYRGPTARVAAGDLYRAYREWAGRQGEEPITQNAFGRELTARGIPPPVPGTDNIKWRKGIGLQATAREDAR